jgi:hypothetical protein
MSIDFRLPNITARDEAGQLRQMQSFMFQLVEQLNYAMKTVEAGSSGYVAYQGKYARESGSEDAKAQATFNDIKALIIKSADIVNAYYETICYKLRGEYVAISDFGTYTEETSKQIEENSTARTEYYENKQRIDTSIDNLEHSLIEVNANIRTGLLYYDEDGAPVYGLEIGQRTEIDGEETFNKYARFTSSKLSFYDSNDNEVAYISDKKLYITNVEITGSFTLSGFVDKVLADRSVVTKWVGGDG